MKFSLLVPTRKREKLFNNLCKSIENTTRNLQEIEFLANKPSFTLSDFKMRVIDGL